MGPSLPRASFGRAFVIFIISESVLADFYNTFVFLVKIYAEFGVFAPYLSQLKQELLYFRSG